MKKHVEGNITLPDNISKISKWLKGKKSDSPPKIEYNVK